MKYISVKQAAELWSLSERSVRSINSPAVYRAAHCGAGFLAIVEKFSRSYRESLGCCQLTERVHGISVVSGSVYSFGKFFIVL